MRARARSRSRVEVGATMGWGSVRVTPYSLLPTPYYYVPMQVPAEMNERMAIWTGRTCSGVGLGSG